MFWDAAEALESAGSPKVVETMDHVRSFSYGKGLTGGASGGRHRLPGWQDAGRCGPASTLRFDETYMKMAADGAL